MKVAFVTDSGTGKTIEEMKAQGVYSLPLQISYEEENKLDLVEITLEDVNALMRRQINLKTSLPAAGMIEDLFTQLKQEGYDMIFAVPICSGLSGTIQAMKMTAEQVGIAFDYVDCHVTAVVEEYLIVLAKRLYEEEQKMHQPYAGLRSVCCMDVAGSEK